MLEIDKKHNATEISVFYHKDWMFRWRRKTFDDKPVLT